MKQIHEIDRALMGVNIEELGVNLLKELIKQVAALPDVWQKLPKAKQDMVIDALRFEVGELVKNAVRQVAHVGAQDFPRVAVGLKQVTFKDGDVVVQLTASKRTEDVLGLGAYCGSPAVLVVADPLAYLQGIEKIHGEEDQRGLDLNPGEKLEHGEDGAPVLVKSETAPANRETKGEKPETGGTEKGAATEVKKQETPAGQSPVSPVPDADDPMYADAVTELKAQKSVGVSHLQRKLKIGYNRAARLLEKMVADKVAVAVDGGRFQAVEQ